MREDHPEDAYPDEDPHLGAAPQDVYDVDAHQDAYGDTHAGDDPAPVVFHPVSSGAPEPAPGTRAGRRASRQAVRAEREAARRRRRRRVITAVVTVVILAGLGVVVWQVVLPGWNELTEMVTPTSGPEDYPGPGQGEVDVVITAGATGSMMAEVLHESGVVASTTAFTQAFAANPAASSIQPGTYTLKREMPAADAVTALLDPANRRIFRVTLPEGLTASQILDRLSGTTAIPIADFLTAMADTEATGLPAEPVEPLVDEDPDRTLLRRYEGWMFAGTYEFQPGTSATAMIAEMVGRTVAYLDEREVAPEDRLTVLTMASLAEREVRTPEDRRMVTRAISNRLERSMKLDIDASVAYGLGISGTDLTRDLINNTEGPYNLYRVAGLPPTPIASPSLDAIDAVLDPAEGPWLFWVTINLDTGETRFAETMAEHEANVVLLREWQAQQGQG